MIHFRKQHYLLLFFFTFIVISAKGQVTVVTDFTNKANKKQKLHDVWSVVNRISPKKGVSVAKGMGVNLVRMVGGINKVVNGKRVPNYKYDPCRYDSVTNKYIYNWKPLITRINNVKKSKREIFQIVLDQPCWAFQHGYNFLSDDEPYNGKDFKESERVSIYGNSLPPKDRVAYSEFVKAMMKKLVATYGKKQVLEWRFRVGSEIETPDHWRGTKQDFIDYFADTEKAIRAVLPKAKIGVHTRTPDFLYKKGKEKNYKGEVFGSFAKDLISYCYDNDVKYDFWGISDYVIVNNTRPFNVDEKYEELFAPLINHPKWLPNTKLDVMEYAPVVSIKGRNFMRVSTTHSEIVDLEFTNMFYRNKDKGLGRIYRWGMRKGSKNTGVILETKKMIGKRRYVSEIVGNTTVENNKIDALFVKENKNNFEGIIYNYNTKDLSYKQPEQVTLSMVVDLPVGTRMYYRDALYSRNQNKFQSFLNNRLSTSWLKPNKDKRGDPRKILNKKGLKAWRNFTHKIPYKYSEWSVVKTVTNPNSKLGSKIVINTKLPSFSYRKLEFKTDK